MKQLELITFYKIKKLFPFLLVLMSFNGFSQLQLNFPDSFRFCIGDTGVINAAHYAQGAVVKYVFNNSVNDSILKVVKNGQHFITVLDSNQNLKTAIFDVWFDSIPEAKFVYLGCPDLMANFENNSINGVGFHWDFGDGNTSNSTNKIVKHQYNYYPTAIDFYIKLRAYNGCGKDSITRKITWDISYCFDSAEDHLRKSLTIYPNPARNSITIKKEITSESQFELYNSLGQRVLKKILDEQTKVLNLPVMNLQPGIYLYKFIINKQSHVSGKLLITK